VKYLQTLVIGVTLILPAAVTMSAQDRDRQEQTAHRYEDKAHHDSHEWNERENEAYRRYLQEHHKKYHEFDKAKTREQNDYWKWRHSHPDEDRH
jgi:type III secretory pathway component EscR